MWDVGNVRFRETHRPATLASTGKVFVAAQMKYLEPYNNYLKRLAQAGTQTAGLGSIGFGPIIIAVAPFSVAIFIQSSIIAAFGSGGPVTSASMDAITLILLIGLFYSGFKVVSYRSERNNRKGEQ
jgi:hypothetical protein